MKRRGFFGLMGGAVVAGPSMAKTAISTGLEGLSIGAISGMPEPPYPFATAASDISDISPFDPGHWAQRELADFLGKSAEELAEMRLNTSVSAIDPDISIMRSISLDSKIRMQRDRTFARNRAESHRYLKSQLVSAIKRFTS